MKITEYYLRAFDNMLKLKDKDEDHSFLKEGDTSFQTYVFPIEDEILKKDNLFRRYGTIVKVNKNDNRIVATESNAKAVICDEAAGYIEQSDSFSNITFKPYKLATLSKIKRDFISDNDFDVKNYLTHEFARRFGKAEEDIALNGTGVSEPKGLLNVVTTGVTTSEITYDSLVDLYFSVDKEYRSNAIWIMNDETAIAIRKLKDENGNPIWNSDKDTIFSKPVVISNYMEDAEKPILFGDVSYFWALIANPISVKVLKERYMVTDDIGYAANERLDCKLVRSNAIKVLVINEEE